MLHILVTVVSVQNWALFSDWIAPFKSPLNLSRKELASDVIFSSVAHISKAVLNGIECILDSHSLTMKLRCNVFSKCVCQAIDKDS